MFNIFHIFDKKFFHACHMRNLLGFRRSIYKSFKRFWNEQPDNFHSKGHPSMPHAFSIFDHI